jgi:hypothetical protein
VGAQDQTLEDLAPVEDDVVHVEVQVLVADQRLAPAARASTLVLLPSEISTLLKYLSPDLSLLGKKRKLSLLSRI